MILVVPMLIAIPEDVVPFAVVDPDTSAIHLSIANWNLAVKILVEPMLNVNLKADLPFVNVLMDTVEILTPIVSVILVAQIPAVPMLFVKTMAMLPCAGVRMIMLEIPTYLALLTLAKLRVVDQTRIARLVDKDLFVDAFEDSLEIPTADLDVLRILVPSSIFVEPTPIVATKEEDPSASVNPDTKAILILVAFVVIVFQILNVELIRLVKITNVLILVNYLVDPELIVKSKIMWQFVDVLEDLLEIHSRAAENLLKMRFVKLVEQILIVK